MTPGEHQQVKAALADLRAAGRRNNQRHQDIRLHLQEPGRARRRWSQAGQLLDAAGCRGLRVGGAGFSEKHANFIENQGEATTADVIELMAKGRRGSEQRFGVELEPEVQSARSHPEFPHDWRHA